MPGRHLRRRALVGVLAITVVAAAAFIFVILIGFRATYIHEIAAGILLGLLAGALGLAVSLHDHAVGIRAALALGCLVGAALLGGALAAGRLPSDASGLPLLPLAALIGVAADGWRLAWKPGEAASPSA